MQYFAMRYFAFENITLGLNSIYGIATTVVRKFLMLLIYILGTPLVEMAFTDQSHTQHLDHSHLWIFQHVRQTLDIDTVQCQ